MQDETTKGCLTAGNRAAHHRTIAVSCKFMWQVWQVPLRHFVSNPFLGYVAKARELLCTTSLLSEL